MARVPYLDPEDLPEALRELLARPINLNRALVNSPEARRHFGALGHWIRHGSRLDPRLRELAILQVGWQTRAPYEWSHHLKIGRDFGVTEADVEALVAWNEGRAPEGGALGELEQLVLSAAREMTDTLRMSDATWEALARHLEIEHLVDLTLVIAFYNAVVRLLATLEIDVEPEYEEWLERHPLPES